MRNPPEASLRVWLPPAIQCAESDAPTAGRSTLSDGSTYSLAVDQSADSVESLLSLGPLPLASPLASFQMLVPPQPTLLWPICDTLDKWADSWGAPGAAAAAAAARRQGSHGYSALEDSLFNGQGLCSDDDSDDYLLSEYGTGCGVGDEDGPDCPRPDLTKGRPCNASRRLGWGAPGDDCGGWGLLLEGAGAPHAANRSASLPVLSGNGLASGGLRSGENVLTCISSCLAYGQLPAHQTASGAELHIGESSPAARPAGLSASAATDGNTKPVAQWPWALQPQPLHLPQPLQLPQLLQPPFEQFGEFEQLEQWAAPAGDSASAPDSDGGSSFTAPPCHGATHADLPLPANEGAEPRAAPGSDRLLLSDAGLAFGEKCERTMRGGRPRGMGTVAAATGAGAGGGTARALDAPVESYQPPPGAAAVGATRSGALAASPAAETAEAPELFSAPAYAPGLAIGPCLGLGSDGGGGGRDPFGGRPSGRGSSGVRDPGSGHIGGCGGGDDPWAVPVPLHPVLLEAVAELRAMREEALD